MQKKTLTLKDWLFKPFNYLAGSRSLILGITILLLTAITGYFGGIRFDGVLDAHLAESPIRLHLLDQAINWLTMSIILLLAGWFLNPGFRIIDLLGTQAMARSPMLLVGLFTILTPIANTNDKLMGFVRYKLFNEGEPVTFPIGDLSLLIGFAIISLICLVWMVYLMYHAFSTVSHVKGAKAITAFIIAVILAEALSKFTLFLI